MLLEVFSDLVLPPGTEHLLAKLNLNLSPTDGMYAGNPRHYLSCGASALNVVLAALRLAEISSPAKILDFGAGAGRVTRWLRAAFPNAEIDACDLRAEDLVFCQEQFQARTWISGVDIDALHAPQKYDLIWLGSVITHLSEKNALNVIEKMLSWTNPGGVIVMSFHGKYALSRQDSGEFKYIHDSAWNLIRSGYQQLGYGYADYEGQTGYGISLTKPAWFAKALEKPDSAKLILLTECAWDNHHDVLALAGRNL